MCACGGGGGGGGGGELSFSFRKDRKTCLVLRNKDLTRYSLD